MPQRFRTKIVEVDATRFTGSNFYELEIWTNGYFRPVLDYRESQVVDAGLITAEVFDALHNTWIGVVRGQWIVRGAKGEFYPCDDETFHWKYEEVVMSGDTKCEPVGSYL